MESVQTQQERDRQTRLERRRQQEREKRARETPEERDRRRSLRNQRDRERRRARCAARCASALAQLERVCTCIIIRIYIRELAHARPPMSSISLVLLYMYVYRNCVNYPLYCNLIHWSKHWCTRGYAPSAHILHSASVGITYCTVASVVR